MIIYGNRCIVTKSWAFIIQINESEFISFFFLIGNFILHVSGKALILFAVSADDAIKVALKIRTASKDYHCKNSFHGVSGISRYDNYEIFCCSHHGDEHWCCDTRACIDSKQGGRGRILYLKILPLRLKWPFGWSENRTFQLWYQRDPL